MTATQPQLWKEPKKRQAKQDAPVVIEAKWRRYYWRNCEAARIILADSERFEGLPLIWARAFRAEQ